MNKARISAFLLIASICAGCAQPAYVRLQDPSYKPTRFFSDEELKSTSEVWIRKMNGEPSRSTAMLGGQYLAAASHCKSQIPTTGKEQADQFLERSTGALKLDFYAERYPNFLSWVQEYQGHYKAALISATPEQKRSFCDAFLSDVAKAYNDAPPKVRSIDGPGFHQNYLFNVYFSPPDAAAVRRTRIDGRVGNIAGSIMYPLHHLSKTLTRQDRYDPADMSTWPTSAKACTPYEAFTQFEATKDDPVWYSYNSILSCI